MPVLGVIITRGGGACVCGALKGHAGGGTTKAERVDFNSVPKTGITRTQAREFSLRKGTLARRLLALESQKFVDMCMIDIFFTRRRKHQGPGV